MEEKSQTDSNSFNVSPSQSNFRITNNLIHPILHCSGFLLAALDVQQWLCEKSGLPHERCIEIGRNFVQNNITGDVLPLLNHTSLSQLGVTLVGDQLRILEAISHLLAGRKTHIDFS